MANKSYILDIIVNAGGNAAENLGNVAGKLGGIAKFAGGAAVAGLGALAVGMGAVVKGGLDINTSLENVEAQLLAFTKDGDVAKGILADIRNEAAKTPFAFEEMAKATAGLLPAAKQSGAELMDLVKQAEILAASNPEQGLEGAAFALREAVSGDFTSIIERFNLPRQYINQLKEEGVPALEIVSRAMGEVGFDMDLVSNLAQTADGRWSTFWDTIDTIKATLSQPIFDLIKEGLIGVQGLLDANMPTIQAWAQMFGDGIAGIIQGFVDFGRYIGAVLEDGDTLNDWLTHLPEGIQPFVQAIGEAVAWVVENWPQIAATVGDVIERIRSVIVAILTPAIEHGVGRFQYIRDWIDENMPLIQETVRTVLTWIGDFWKQHGDAIMRVVTNFMDVVQTIMDTQLANILDIVKVVMQLITGDWEGAGETLKGIWDRTWETIKTVTGTVLDSILTILGEFIPDFDMSGENLINALLDGLKSTWTKVTEWFGGLAWPSLPAIDWNPFDGQPAGNAAGTPYWRGGLSMVGENGPELVAMPRGAQVHSADQTRSMAQSQPTNVWNITIPLSGRATEADGQRVAQGFLSEMRAMGVR